jgi:hypothetical protein
MTDKRTRTAHDSFGLIHFSRWTSSHAQNFFGSDIKHDRGIRITISSALLERSLGADHHYEDKLMLAADMTENAFAEMITTLNIGTGVPITLKTFADGDLVIPAPPPDVPKGELVLREARDSAKEGTAELRKVIASLRDLLEGGNLRKAGIRQLIRELEAAVSKFDDHVPFMLEQFTRTVEKMVTDAKATVRAAASPVVIESLTDMGAAIEQGLIADHSKKPKKKKKDKKRDKKD